MTRSFYILFDLRLSEQTIKQTTETQVIWDVIALIVTSLLWYGVSRPLHVHVY